MASPPQATTLSVEAFAGISAEDRKLVEKLAFILNPFFNDIVANLDSSLSFADNFQGQVRKVSFTMPDEWVALTLQNGWTRHADTTFPLPAQRKTADGRVYTRGLIERAAGVPASPSDVALGVYPAAARSRFAANGAVLTVETTGMLTFDSGTAIAFLDTVQFDAADRRPPNLAAPFPLVVSLERDFPGTPRHVLVLGAVDTVSKAPVAGVSVSASPTAVDGAPAISIQDVRGCSPGRSYELTVLVIPE